MIRRWLATSLASRAVRQSENHSAHSLIWSPFSTVSSQNTKGNCPLWRPLFPPPLRRPLGSEVVLAGSPALWRTWTWQPPGCSLHTAVPPPPSPSQGGNPGSAKALLSCGDVTSVPTTLTAYPSLLADPVRMTHSMWGRGHPSPGAFA